MYQYVRNKSKFLKITHTENPKLSSTFVFRKNSFEFTLRPFASSIIKKI